MGTALVDSTFDTELKDAVRSFLGGGNTSRRGLLTLLFHLMLFPQGLKNLAIKNYKKGYINKCILEMK